MREQEINNIPLGTTIDEKKIIEFANNKGIAVKKQNQIKTI